MKRLSIFFAALLLSVGSVMAETVAYTLTPAVGENNNYAKNGDVQIGDITWNVSGNVTVTPWRIGGKSITNTDRALYSKTAIEKNISKIEVTHGNITCTVNSMKLIVSDASNAKGDTLTGTCTKDTTTTFTRPAESDWTGKFYKIVYNVTVAGTRNQYVQFSEAKFYTDEAAAVLSPTFVPEEGKVVDGAFTESFTLTMSCETADATIQYTLDGSNPAEATAMTYSEPITIPAASTQVRAIAIKGGDKSFETEQVYAFINTPATAYTVTEAKAIIDKGLGLDHELYGKGTIKSIKGYYNNKYITYNITDGENDLTVYNGLGLEKAAFGAKTDLNIGDQVVVYGKLVKFSGTYEFNTDNYLISLIPAPQMYTITAKVNDDAMGSVTGAGEYEENATATLTANANEGYEFVNWTVGEETKTDNPLTITVAADMTITANFQEKATPAEVVTMLWKEDSYTFNTGVHARDMDYYDGKLYVMNKNDKKIYTIDAVTGKADAEAYVALDNLTGYSVCADNAGNLIATEGAYGMTNCLKASKVVNGVATYLGNTATATGRIDYLDVYGDIESAEGAMIIGASTNNADKIAIWTMKNGALENAATPTILAGKRGNFATNADVCIVDQNQFWTSGAGQNPMLFTLNADKTDATVQTLNVSCDLGGIAAFTLNKKDYVVLPSGKAGAVALYDVTDIANPEMVETTAFVGLNVSGLTHVAIAANVNGNSAYIYVFAPNGGAAAYQFTPAHTPTSVENSAIVAPKAVKVLRNGQVLIIRDGKTYDMMGQMVE